MLWLATVLAFLAGTLAFDRPAHAELIDGPPDARGYYGRCNVRVVRGPDMNNNTAPPPSYATTTSFTYLCQQSPNETLPNSGGFNFLQHDPSDNAYWLYSIPYLLPLPMGEPENEVWRAQHTDFTDADCWSASAPSVDRGGGNGRFWFNVRFDNWGYGSEAPCDAESHTATCGPDWDTYMTADPGTGLFGPRSWSAAWDGVTVNGSTKTRPFKVDSTVCLDAGAESDNPTDYDWPDVWFSGGGPGNDPGAGPNPHCGLGGMEILSGPDTLGTFTAGATYTWSVQVDTPKVAVWLVGDTGDGTTDPFDQEATKVLNPPTGTPFDLSATFTETVTDPHLMFFCESADGTVTSYFPTDGRWERVSEADCMERVSDGLSLTSPTSWLRSLWRAGVCIFQLLFIPNDMGKLTSLWGSIKTKAPFSYAYDVLAFIPNTIDATKDGAVTGASECRPVIGGNGTTNIGDETVTGTFTVCNMATESGMFRSAFLYLFYFGAAVALVKIVKEAVK